MKTSVKKRIATAGTLLAYPSTCIVNKIVISCENAGTTFTLRIEDKFAGGGAADFVLVPTFTLTVPSNGQPIVIPTTGEFAVRMDGGINIITSGTPGEVAVWMDLTISD